MEQEKSETSSEGGKHQRTSNRPHFHRTHPLAGQYWPRYRRCELRSEQPDLWKPHGWMHLEQHNKPHRAQE